MQDTNTQLPKKAGVEIGESGTLIYRGIISGEEYNANLVGRNLINKVEIMRRSSTTVRAALLVVKLPILGADWTIKPAEDADGKVSDVDQEIADYVNRELFNRKINFSDFLRQGLTCLDFGFSIFEKVYELTDFNGKPRIGLSKLAFRKQNTKYAWQQEDGSPGITQMAMGGTYSIPRDKLVVFVYEKEGDNDDGISLLRFPYKDWDMLDKLTVVNAIALEKLGVGLPIIYERDGEQASPADLKQAEVILSQMRANEAAFLRLPSTIQFEFADMKGSTTKDIIPTLNYHDSRISKGILAGFMDLGGQSGSGSQSLSKDLTSLFMKSEEATAKQLQTAMMEDLIKPLVDLNYANLENGYPELSFGSISDDDLSETATSLATLADKKLLTPDLETESFIRNKYRLPALSDEARENYEANQQASLTLQRYPTETPTNPTSTDPAKTGTETLEEDSQKTKPDPAKVQASLEEARAAAKRAKGLFQDVLASAN